jgi:hypothetical protein
MFVSTVTMLMLMQAGAAAAPAANTKAGMDARIRAGFTRLDTNKDGFVDKAEADRAQSANLTARQAKFRQNREAAFAQFDTNKDGSISRDEFLNTGAPRAPAQNAYLTRYDIDKNGRVALAEALAKETNDFERLDTDKNGTISPAEARAAQARRAQRK